MQETSWKAICFWLLVCLMFLTAFSVYMAYRSYLHSTSLYERIKEGDEEFKELADVTEKAVLNLDKITARYKALRKVLREVGMPDSIINAKEVQITGELY